MKFIIMEGSITIGDFVAVTIWISIVLYIRNLSPPKCVQWQFCACNSTNCWSSVRTGTHHSKIWMVRFPWKERQSLPKNCFQIFVHSSEGFLTYLLISLVCHKLDTPSTVLGTHPNTSRNLQQRLLRSKARKKTMLQKMQKGFALATFAILSTKRVVQKCEEKMMRKKISVRKHDRFSEERVLTRHAAAAKAISATASRLLQLLVEGNQSCHSLDSQHDFLFLLLRLIGSPPLLLLFLFSKVKRFHKRRPPRGAAGSLCTYCYYFGDARKGRKLYLRLRLQEQRGLMDGRPQTAGRRDHRANCGSWSSRSGSSCRQRPARWSHSYVIAACAATPWCLNLPTLANAMCFARAADHLQTPLSAALAPLQLKKPPTPAGLSRAKREEEACKQMFFKQTSHPKRKNRYSSGRATTTSKTKQNRIKQTKSSNCNEIPTRESKMVSNKLQLQTKSTTLRKGNSTVLVRTQRETKRDEGEKERSREETSETASERASRDERTWENPKETERARGAREYTTG